VLQLVLQVVPRSVLGSLNSPSKPGLLYASALLIGRPRLRHLRHRRCLIQVRGSFAHQPAFGLR
jgi:hypothetical protein